MDLPNITLTKPLGSDIYNIEVFNNNSTIIEQYLNQFLLATTIGLKVYNYPEDSEIINIDDVEQGIYNCDGMIANNVSGTLPDETLSKDKFQLWCVGDTTSLRFQIFIDLSYSVNNMSIRSKQPGATVWSNWNTLAKLSDIISSAGFTINYVTPDSGLDLDSTPSGTYIVNGELIVTGTKPMGITGTSYKLLLNSFGDSPGNLKVQNLYDLSTNPAIMYSRYMYLDTVSSNYVWSEWEEGAMGGNSIKLSLVDL